RAGFSILNALVLLHLLDRGFACSLGGPLPTIFVTIVASVNSFSLFLSLCLATTLFGSGRTGYWSLGCVTRSGDGAFICWCLGCLWCLRSIEGSFGFRCGSLFGFG